MGKHALFSPSAAHRWINCPPSLRLNESEPDTESNFAQEGTDAHSLCEYKLKKLLGMDVKSPVENLTYYDTEMEECTEYYAQEVYKAYCSTNNPELLIEQKLDMSDFVPDCFGTADSVVIADRTLKIFDFKYGKNVEVSAEENPQMMLYALGVIDMFDGIYDIYDVHLSIIQPRMNNYSAFAVTKDYLLEWAENVLKPAAKLAYDGEGELNSGDWCKFCKVKAKCHKLKEENLKLAEYEFKQPYLLSNDEIAEILPQIENLTAWAGAVKEYALNQALKGEKFNGYKLVEGRSVRKYTDENSVAEAVKDAGFDPYTHDVLGITAMEKMLGKTRFNKLLGELVHKPKGKPVLVPDSDKRPPYKESAADDFTEV